MSYCYYYKNSTEVMDPPPPTPGVLSCTLRTTDLEFTVTHTVPVLAAACRNVVTLEGQEKEHDSGVR